MVVGTCEYFNHDCYGGVQLIVNKTLGPAIGPVVGSFVCVHLGWRWMFWILAIVSGATTIFAIVFMRETSALAILERKAKKLRSKHANPNIRSKLHNGMSPGQLFMYSIVRPAKMLLFSPVVLSLSIYVAVVYGYLYLMFTTVGDVFATQYRWPRDMVGLAFLGLGVGCFIGQVTYTMYENHNYLKHKARGDLVPEHKLNSMIVGAICLPISLFWYGWSVQAGVHCEFFHTSKLLIRFSCAAWIGCDVYADAEHLRKQSIPRIEVLTTTFRDVSDCCTGFLRCRHAHNLCEYILFHRHPWRRLTNDT